MDNTLSFVKSTCNRCHLINDEEEKDCVSFDVDQEYFVQLCIDCIHEMASFLSANIDNSTGFYLNGEPPYYRSLESYNKYYKTDYKTKEEIPGYKFKGIANG